MLQTSLKETRVRDLLVASPQKDAKNNSLFGTFKIFFLTEKIFLEKIYCTKMIEL